VLLGGLSPLVWWPFRELQSSVTTTVPLAQLPIAFLLGIAGGALVAFIHGDIGGRRFQMAVMRSALIIGVLGLLVVMTPGNAWAHDPGQGEEAEQVQMSFARTADTANLRLVMPTSCEKYQPVSVTARRAGQTKTGELRIVEAQNDECVTTGTVNGLTNGRWFVYAELKNSEGTWLEAWLPVNDDASVAETRPLYEPPTRQSSASQITIGAGLLVIVIGIIVLTLRLSRQASRVPVPPTGP
jgi:hypothetical protein